MSTRISWDTLSPEDQELLLTKSTGVTVIQVHYESWENSRNYLEHYGYGVMVRGFYYRGDQFNPGLVVKLTLDKPLLYGHLANLPHLIDFD